MPTTSSTRTSARTTSTPGGTWSTGRRWPSASRATRNVAEGDRDEGAARLAGETHIDPGLAAWVEEIRREPGRPVAEIGAGALRARSRARAASRPRGPEVARVRDVALPPAARLYEPAGALDALAVYLQGGGFVSGDLESHDRTCRRMAATAGVRVLAVDWRKGPEHPWPAGVDDAVAAAHWAAQRAERILLAGDSAGGCVAALACIALRDAGGPQPVGQVLINPNTDLTLGCLSVQEKGSGWGLEARDLAWFVAQWVPDDAARAAGAGSPLHAPDLSGLPAAIVVTAEHDPLRDEGDAYAERLAQAGVAVEHRTERGLVHGFLGLDAISPVAAVAGERIFAGVRRLLT